MRNARRSRFFCALLTFLLITGAIGSYGGPAHASNTGEIPVYIDGLPVDFEVHPLIQNGRTMVPFRALAEALGISVTWDGPSRTVEAGDGSNTIKLQIDNTTAYKNSTAVKLDVPPMLINGRTLVPLRFFSESLGCRVDWIEAAHTVKIASPPKQMEVVGFYALGDSSTSSWKNLFGTKFPQSGPGNTDSVSTLALGWYSLDKDGELLTKSRTGWQRPDDWEKVLEAAKKYNLKTEMVVHMADGDGSASGLISNNPAIAEAVSGITAEAINYNGVNIDIEGLGWSGNNERMLLEREKFTGFIKLLSKNLKEKEISLTVTLHPPNSAYKGYDYRSLGLLADRVIIMAYDYGPKPEPINMVVQAVEEAIASVPPQKLVLGISAPSETPESILTKIGIAKKYKLSGIALWRLGLVPDGMWNSLRATVKAKY
ncbi:MAG: stalk domain-containing protein [Bacillota bacterium]